MCLEGDKQSYDYWESQWKSGDKKFWCAFSDKGEGMVYVREKGVINGGVSYLMDTIERRIYYMAGRTAYNLGFEREDVDWENVSRFPDTYQADNMRARYAFGITDFEDGIAKVSWGITPDPMYSADSDGYGMGDDEVILCAFIDRHCRVLVKFQSMEKQEKEMECRKLALARLNEVSVKE